MKECVDVMERVGEGGGGIVVETVGEGVRREEGV
jgi:hypothetical protein